MLRFISKLKSKSCFEAKNRLKSVINSDRMNTNDNNTLEKIRKEVTEVLEKYTSGHNDVSVFVYGCKDSGYSLTAKVSGSTVL